MNKKGDPSPTYKTTLGNDSVGSRDSDNTASKSLPQDCLQSLSGAAGSQSDRLLYKKTTYGTVISFQFFLWS